MGTARVFLNPVWDPTRRYGAGHRWILDHARSMEAVHEIGSWPGYAETPLHDLRGLANEVGVARLWYKDESSRFGLGSFKALGGAYGVLHTVLREVLRRTGRCLTGREVRDGAAGRIAANITVTTATDGNHGRSVAWGARQFGCRCAVYLPAAATPGRAAAIERFGATVVRVDGDYDRAVRAVHADAARHQRFVVSDTSYPGYVDVPRVVMEGYTVLAHEVLRQLPPDAAPTHLFVQGGVGGLAASVIAHVWEARAVSSLKSIVVEPVCADCLYRSAEAGTPTSVPGDVHATVMAGLACGEVSPLAWEIVQPGTFAFMAIHDEPVVRAMRRLARPTDADPAIVAGESGAAGVAGLLVAASTSEHRAALRLDADARVLVVGSEGATDPEVYARLVGDG